MTAHMATLGGGASAASDQPLPSHMRSTLPAHLRNDGTLRQETMRLIQRDLDLQEARLPA
jgi:hypothetical protein